MRTVNFVDFWTGPGRLSNIGIFKNIIERYNLELTYEVPDILFFSVFGEKNKDKKYSKCLKIFYTGENIHNRSLARHRVKFIYDYSLTFDYETEHNYRLPNFIMQGGFESIERLNNLSKNDIKEKTNFCSFIYSNAAAPVRNSFFNALSKYKKINSGGKVKNNIGHKVGNKIEFLKSYKFDIAFENTKAIGYTTEKIIHSMQSMTIPLYWGNVEVYKDFNPDSYIHVNENNFKESLKKIEYLDNNDTAYFEMLNQPWFKDNKIPDHFKSENFYKFMDKVIK